MIFFIDSEIQETIPLQFPRWFFSFLQGKIQEKLRIVTFSSEYLRGNSQSGGPTTELQAPPKGGNFGPKLAHLCGLWLDVSFF